MTAKRKRSERARPGPGPLRLSATRRAVVLAAAVLLALGGACGNDGDPDPESATATDERGDGSSAADGQTDTEAGDGGRSGDAGTGGGGGGDAPALTAAEICRLIPGDDVAGALGVDATEASPGTSETPQCSYVFEAESGARSDATVAALRTEEDLGGRAGREAFDYVVDLNRDASRSDPDQTEPSVGDRSIVLSGSGIHFGVVQLGPRIVTTIVSARVAEADAAVALTRLTPALAP